MSFWLLWPLCAVGIVLLIVVLAGLAFLWDLFAERFPLASEAAKISAALGAISALVAGFVWLVTHS